MTEKTIQLRPHHLLCIRFWQGKGYSPAFSQKMEQVIAALNRRVPVTINDGFDDLCSACPNKKGSICESEEHVQTFDSKVREFCGIKQGDSSEWASLYERVSEKIMAAHRFEEVCGDCAFANVCHT